MKHALVVGGTGMLANVTLWLVNNGYQVSVIGRNPARMNDLILQPTNPAQLIPILVDYRNEGELEEQIENLIARIGHIDLMVVWIHSEADGALEVITQQNAGYTKEWTLLHVLGSRADADAIKRHVTVPDNCLYRQVQLGFILENYASRWLTHDEISVGVIESIMSHESKRVVGVLEPWEFRP